jgi:hypothetical protein
MKKFTILLLMMLTTINASEQNLGNHHLSKADKKLWTDRNQYRLISTAETNAELPNDFQQIMNQSPNLYNDFDVQYERLKYLEDVDSEANTYFDAVAQWKKDNYFTIVTPEDVEYQNYLKIDVPVMNKDLKQYEHLKDIIELYDDQDKIEIISMERFQQDIEKSAERVFKHLNSLNNKFYLFTGTNIKHKV